MKNIHKINNDIYITSDEYIGLSYYLDGNLVRKGVIDDKEYWKVRKDYKKIILTTDQDLIKDGVQAIDDEFLEWFVKNPSCEWVEVQNQYRVKSGTIQEHKDGLAGCEYYEYKIIIPQEEIECSNCGSYMELLPDNSIYVCTNSECTNCYEEDEEPKQETLEEAAESYADFSNDHVPICFGDKFNPTSKADFIAGANYQAERMYSEKEVFEIVAKILHTPALIDGSWEDIGEWFEQHKKK